MQTGLKAPPHHDGYNEGQPPMARTGIRRGLLMGVAAFVVIMALVALNARHEINETPAPAANQSTAVAPKQ